MADLDDFFAKKDRKKSKGKKFTTTEEIAKKLEETGKKVEKPKPKEKSLLNPDTGDENQTIQEEDEWKEFEEEKKDYTGLKIGNLTVTEGPYDDGSGERGSGENGSDQESGEGGAKHSGPWKKTDEPPAPASAAEPEPPQPPPQQAQPPPQASTGYRPPHLRNAGSTHAPMDRPMGLRRNKNIAPDISSEEYFPTLNSKPPSNEAGGAWGRKKRDEGTFEEVRNRGGTRLYSAPDGQSRLSLGNKYGSLSQDQS